MDSKLERLYYTTVSKSPALLQQFPYYQQAMEAWETLSPGNNMELEDAAYLREYEWGFLSFALGLKLGLSLSDELHAL